MRELEHVTEKTAEENIARFLKSMVFCSCCKKVNCFDCVNGTKRFEPKILEPDDPKLKNRRSLFVWHAWQNVYLRETDEKYDSIGSRDSLCLKCFENTFCYASFDKTVYGNNAPLRDKEGLIRHLLNTTVLGNLRLKLMMIVRFSIKSLSDEQWGLAFGTKPPLSSTKGDESEDTEMYEIL
jgi:hypothetical protein